MRTVLVTARPFRERELSRWLLFCGGLDRDEAEGLFELRALFPGLDDWKKAVAPRRARGIIAGIHDRRALVLGRRTARAFGIPDHELSMSWFNQAFKISTRRATTIIETVLAVIPEPGSSWWGRIANAQRGAEFLAAEINLIGHAQQGGR
jgi:hypothetical protein